MRLTAPIHTSDATISTGTFPVKKGVLELADDTPASDVAGLLGNGFELIEQDPLDHDGNGQKGGSKAKVTTATTAEPGA